MDDIVHFMFRLQVDAGGIEILQHHAAHRGSRFGRKRKISSAISCGATPPAMQSDGRSGIRKSMGPCARAWRPIPHMLFRPHEGCFKFAPHQCLGERREKSLVRRMSMPGNSSRRCGSPRGVNLSRSPTENQGRMSVSPAELSAVPPLLLLCLEDRASRMVEKRFAGRRQFDAVSAAVYQLNADFPFEIADLPAERWLGRVELLLGGNGQAACIGHGDEVAEMPELHHNLLLNAAATKLYISRKHGPSLQSLFPADQPLSISKRPCLRRSAFQAGRVAALSGSSPRPASRPCWRGTAHASRR